MDHPDRKFDKANGSRVVLHADDFGMNRAVTLGIVRGFSHGLLTSTSVLTNAPDCARALTAWRELLAKQREGQLPSRITRRQLGDSEQPFDLGIHLNLTQGRPLTGNKYPAQLLDSEGRFPGIYPLFNGLWRKESQYFGPLIAELSAQIEVMKDWGMHPTHLNGHQYIEMLPGVVAIIPLLLKKFSIPVVRVAIERRQARSWLLRHFEIATWVLSQIKRRYGERFRKTMQFFAVPHPDAFCGVSHAGRIDLELMWRFTSALPKGQLLEIGMHPGMAASKEAAAQTTDGWHDPLAAGRVWELDLLTSNDLVDLLEERGISLGRLSSLAPIPLPAAAA